MAGGDDMLSQDVQTYLAVRRAMGFAMKWPGNLLRSFAAFSDAQGQHYVRSEIAIKWSGLAPSVWTRARRFGLLIRLARYLRAEEQRHEVPPPAFGREERPRRTPMFIQEKMSHASSKQHLRSADIPTRSIAGLPTAPSSDFWHALGCGFRKRLICDYRTSQWTALSFRTQSSARVA
jgi:hypothetical protein